MSSLIFGKEILLKCVVWMNQMFKSIPLDRAKMSQSLAEINQILENFEDVQNRLKPTLDVYIAHTEHPLTYLERIRRLLTDLKFRLRDQIFDNFEEAQNRPECIKYV